MPVLRCGRSVSGPSAGHLTAPLQSYFLSSQAPAPKAGAFLTYRWGLAPLIAPLIYCFLTSVSPKRRKVHSLLSQRESLFSHLPRPLRCLWRGTSPLKISPLMELTEKVHNVKWINNWALFAGLLRKFKLLYIINAKYLCISLIFSTLAENFQLC